MTDDFGTDFATELAAYFYDGDEITAPPAEAYVTLYDDAGNELNTDLQNGRVSTGIPLDWEQGADPTIFENGAEIDFGESLADITVQEFAIKESDADDDTALIYYRADVNGAPLDFADGTRVFFEAGDLTVDILD